MFVSSNSLKDSLAYFKRKLKSNYDEAEIENIFFLVCFEVFQTTKVQVLADSVRLSESDLLQIKSIVDRLVKNEPIQYIIGHTYFYDCKINVNQTVLIPRPETEELVDIIIKSNNGIDSLSILDIGTGSGCIPIALKKKLKSANITTIDISKDAIALAKENAIQNQVEINFYDIDVFSADINSFDKVDIIVSNPPYIPSADKKEMHKNVLDHEPSTALFVEDTTPLVFYERIIKLSKSKLKPGGQLYFEFHKDFGKEINQLLVDANFQEIEIIKDMQGFDRFSKAIK